MNEHEQHSEIMRAVGRLEGKVDSICNRLDTINGRIGKSEDKVNNLESFKDTLNGKIAIIATIAASVASLVVGYLTKKL